MNNDGVGAQFEFLFGEFSERFFLGGGASA